MKAFAYVLAAIATIAIATPTIASAETVVIKRGHHHHGWHHGWRHHHYDHGWHHGWRHHHHHGGRIVIRR